VLSYENIYVKSKNKTLLHIEKIDIDQGDFVLIVGPSGSGKSTFLNLTAGFISPKKNLFSLPSFSQTIGLQCSGNISFGDKDFIKLPPQERDVGLIFQKNSNYPHLSVLDNISFPLKCSGVPSDERLEIAEKISERVKLPRELLKRKAASLSGGEQQRLAIAKLLAKNPKIRLLDEPFAHLDPILRSELRAIVSEHEKKSNISFMVSHNWEDLKVANKVLLVTSYQKDNPVNAVLINLADSEPDLGLFPSGLQKSWLGKLLEYKNNLN